MKKVFDNDFKRAFLATVPVFAGYMVLGMGFGVILQSKGYGILWAFAMSAYIYAGSMQYLAIDLMSAGASVAATALTTLMVNARHLFYGISMVDKYKNMGKRKPYAIFALTDETYSLVCSEENVRGIENREKFYFLVSLFNQCYWVAGCVLGSIIGSLVKFNTEGIDFALTALFVTVFIEQWCSTKNHTSAVVGVAVSLACLLIFGPDNFLVPAMIGITLALTFLRRKLEGRENG